jgi:5-methylcytosine-specific restriction endonuclease McrA
MIPLKRLLTPVSEIIVACSSNYRDKNKQTRFEREAETIEEYSNDCCDKMQQLSNTSVIQRKPKQCSVTEEEMIGLYENKFARKGQPGRQYYDSLMVLAPLDLCPYCEIGHVETIDHYLSKSEYPYLAVSPDNLVPSCNKCNHGKGSISAQGNTPILNPYFDHVDGEWLFAVVHVEDGLPAARYGVSPNPSWSADLRSKVEEHFCRLDLAKRYSIHASVELSNIPANLAAHGNNLSNEAALDFFKRTYLIRRESKKNGWDVALYRNLAENDEFAGWALDKAKNLRCALSS